MTLQIECEQVEPFWNDAIEGSTGVMYGYIRHEDLPAELQAKLPFKEDGLDVEVDYEIDSYHEAVIKRAIIFFNNIRVELSLNEINSKDISKFIQERLKFVLM